MTTGSQGESNDGLFFAALRFFTINQQLTSEQ